MDELPTRLKEDNSVPRGGSSPGEARNLHPAFAQTQLQPFDQSPSPGGEPTPAPPQPWLEPDAAGYPAPPISHQGYPASPGATTLQGLGEVERAPQAGYPQGPFGAGEGQGFIPPRVAEQTSHTSAGMSSRRLVLTPIAIGAAAGLVVTVVVVGVIVLVREPAPVPVPASASVTVVQVATAAPQVASLPLPMASLAVASGAPPAAATDADAKAQAALEKLKGGIEQCVKTTIHVLPGASPPVPSSISWLKSGPYESLKRDWASPFFSCTRFKLEEPMPFMIQWQVDIPNEKGTAVVWLDPNGDGVVDRAYGFKATLVKRNSVEFGPVEPIDAARKVQRAH